MRKTIALATILLMALTCNAQEKAINIIKTDGTTTETRMAELDEISFLTINPGTQGLIIKTVGGEKAGILFESNPVVSITKGVLSVKSTSPDVVSFEVSDIAEIIFGDASEAAGINRIEGFSCVMRDGSLLLRNIPEGITPSLYSVDGRSVPMPTAADGQLEFSPSSIGRGVFILKVGTFTTKLKF